VADEFDGEGLEDAQGERASVLPALAEMHRRAGRLEEAEQVARRGLEFDPEQQSARVVLALALIQRGRPEAARQALEPLADALLARHGMDDAPPAPRRPDAPQADPSVSEDEFERAFAAARPERERMIDADDIAARAIRLADLEVDADDEGDPEGAPFATHTVADLLERQGDPEAARQMRAALETCGGDSERRRVLGELERWLLNLQRPRA